MVSLRLASSQAAKGKEALKPAAPAPASAAAKAVLGAEPAAPDPSPGPAAPLSPPAPPVPPPAPPVSSAPATVAERAAAFSGDGVRRPSLLVAGLLAACAAQALFDARRPEGAAIFRALLGPIGESTRVAWGGVLLLAAVALWIGALRAGKPSAARAAPLVWPRSLSLLLLPALACAAFALVRFARAGEDAAVRVAWAASIILFLAGTAIAARREGRTPGGRDPAPANRDSRHSSRSA